MQRKLDRKRFVRYKEGAELYSMCQSKFEDMARDAGAVYKLNKLSCPHHQGQDSPARIRGPRLPPSLRERLPPPAGGAAPVHRIPEGIRCR